MSIHDTVVGTGPIDVVFMHGLFGQGKNWTSVAKAISSLATSHLADMPNHGHSAWTAEFSYDEHAEIMSDWIKDNFDEPVVIVGHSMGGKIAMRVALTEPELVKALVIVDISPDRNDSALGFTSLVAGLRSLDLDTVASRGYADQELRERIPNDMVRRFLLQNLQRDEDSWSWLANLDLLGDSLHAISGWPPIGGTFDGPTLWVIGGQSDYCKPEHDAPMRELFPTVSKITLKKAGHWVHSEDPDSFIDVMQAFLSQLPG